MKTKPNPLILHIESSSSVCSIAVSQGSETVASKEVYEKNSHASVLTVLIQDICKEIDISVKHLDAVAFSSGPGSYTGLRIGCSIAKGICYASEIPLIATSTLDVLAYAMRSEVKSKQIKTLYCPTIDARRMDVYTALYDDNWALQWMPRAMEVHADMFLSYLDTYAAIYVGGSGQDKIQAKVSHPKVRFVSHLDVLASMMPPIVLKKYNQSIFENVAYYTPFYLKSFGQK